MVTRHPMTKEGSERLKAELHRLKTIERPRIVNAISEARAHGDLRENAEYHAAKEQQSFNEGRINEIETKLAHAQIVDLTSVENAGKVVFGSTVHLINIETDQEVIYCIVGEDEANLKEAKISFTSPIARALIGKYQGDTVDVITPDGVISYDIDLVEY